MRREKVLVEQSTASCTKIMALRQGVRNIGTISRFRSKSKNLETYEVPQYILQKSLIPVSHRHMHHFTQHRSNFFKLETMSVSGIKTPRMK